MAKREQAVSTSEHTEIDRADAEALFHDLRNLSLRSAERLQGYDRLTEADLYDENGFPA